MYCDESGYLVTDHLVGEASTKNWDTALLLKHVERVGIGSG